MTYHIYRYERLITEGFIVMRQDRQFVPPRSSIKDRDIYEQSGDGEMELSNDMKQQIEREVCAVQRNPEAFESSMRNIGMLILRNKIILPYPYELFERNGVLEGIASALQNEEYLDSVFCCMRGIAWTSEYCQRLEEMMWSSIELQLTRIESRPQFKSNFLRLLVNLSAERNSKCTDNSKVVTVACNAIFQSLDRSLYLPAHNLLHNIAYSGPIRDAMSRRSILEALAMVMSGRTEEGAKCNSFAATILLSLISTESLDLDTFKRKQFGDIMQRNLWTSDHYWILAVGEFLNKYPKYGGYLELDWKMVAAKLERRRSEEVDDEFLDRMRIVCVMFVRLLKWKNEFANEQNVPMILQILLMYWDQANFQFREVVIQLCLYVLAMRDVNAISVEMVDNCFPILMHVNDAFEDSDLSCKLARAVINCRRVIAGTGNRDHIEKDMYVLYGTLIRIFEKVGDRTSVKLLTEAFEE